MGYLDGQPVFGTATTFQPSFEPTAQQVNAFFGINGVQALHGGERGFVIFVSGLFFDVDQAGVVAQETLLLSLRDGVSRTLVDNFGTTYLDVVFDGAYQRWEYGIKPAFHYGFGIGGWAMAYKAAFRGMGA